MHRSCFCEDFASTHTDPKEGIFLLALPFMGRRNLVANNWARTT